MLIQELSILPVNILQIAFIAIATMGLMIAWRLERFRGFAFYFLFYAILMGINFYEETNTSTNLILITPIFTLLKGPIVYLSIRLLINEKPLPHSLTVLHFAPAAIATPFTQYVQEIVFVATFTQITYFILSLKLLRRYHIASMELQSDALSMQLNWIKKVLYIFLAFAVIDLIRLNLQAVNPYHIRASWYFVNLLISLMITSYLVLKIASKPQLFIGITSYRDLIEQDRANGQEDESKLAGEIFAVIDEHIRSKDLYKQPRLSVMDVAEETGFKVKDISWSINSTTSNNFCEFINELRLEEVKKELLSDTKNQNILNIALNAGFNSKSVFYSTFKSSEGMTPSQFKKVNNSQLS